VGTHTSLKAWQHAKRLAVECVKTARLFPPEEQSVLADQLRRAAYGAVLNIAEGTGRSSARDYRRFLVTARASLDEVEAILETARDIGYIDPPSHERLASLRDEAARTLFGLIRSLEKHISAPQPRSAKPA
jgi:four helix bundle protein